MGQNKGKIIFRSMYDPDILMLTKMIILLHIITMILLSQIIFLQCHIKNIREIRDFNLLKGIHYSFRVQGYFFNFN